MRSERQVLFWLAAVILFALALLALQSILLPFVAGMIIAYALNPVADLLERVGVRRPIASAIIVAIVIIIVVVALVFLVPVLVSQLDQFASMLPSELERLKALIETTARNWLGSRFGEFQAGLDKAVADLSQNWAALAAVIASSVWSQGLALFNFVALLLITPLVVFYLLIDWHPMLDRIDGWLPRDHKHTIRRLAAEINDAIAAFIRGQGLVCVILGLVYAIGLTWAGLPYGLLIGLATGLLSFVPFVGWASGLIVACSLAAIQFWPDALPLLKVAGVFALGQALDAGFLSPKIVGSRIGLHPVWLIFALFVFSSLFGFVGVLVAVPLAAAISVLVRFALELYLASSIYRGRNESSVADRPVDAGLKTP